MSEQALDVLSWIAQSEIPAKRVDAEQRTEADIRNIEQEGTIRLAAVRGLSILARKKVEGADDALLEAAKYGDSKAVKAMAVQGYLGAEFSITQNSAVGRNIVNRRSTMSDSCS